MRPSTASLVLLALAAGCDPVPQPAPPGPEAAADPAAPAETPADDRSILAAQLAAAGIGAESPGNPDGEVLLVVLDTLRRDRVSLYAPERATTPRLDAWAVGAQVFESARSVSSWTLPAHASLFTGQYPHQHHVHYMPPDRRRDDGPEAFGLRPGTPTLAKALAGAGYSTLGISANVAYLSAYWNTTQGFEGWVGEQLEPDPYAGYVVAGRITDLALAALEAPRDRPLFLFLNYMDAHKPPVVRRGYLRNPELVPDPPVLPGYPGWAAVDEGAILRGEPLAPELAAAWSEAYDGEVRYLDEQLGRLLEALPRLGIDDNDLVVILSDHGENLGEHALLLHGRDVYETTIAIPLVAAGPGFGPGRSADPVQILDVPRWILEHAGAPLLPDMQRTEGVQLAQQFWSRSSDLRDPELAARFDRIRQAVTQGERKPIHGSDGSTEAYDLGADPEERSPIVQPPWERALLQHVPGQEDRPAQEQPGGHELDQELTPEQLERLRALGYLD